MSYGSDEAINHNEEEAMSHNRFKRELEAMSHEGTEEENAGGEEVFAKPYFADYPWEGDSYGLDDAGFVVTITPEGWPQRRILCMKCDRPIMAMGKRNLGLVHSDGRRSSKAAYQPALRTGKYDWTSPDGTTMKKLAFVMHHIRCVPEKELWAQEDSTDEEYPLLESLGGDGKSKGKGYEPQAEQVCSPPSGTSVGPKHEKTGLEIMQARLAHPETQALPGLKIISLEDLRNSNSDAKEDSQYLAAIASSCADSRGEFAPGRNKTCLERRRER